MLDYLPGEALVEIAELGHTENVECAIVADNFGDVVDHSDYDLTACDFGR